MNNFFSTLLGYVIAAAITACFTMLFGLIARAYWVLFSLGWNAL